MYVHILVGNSDIYFIKPQWLRVVGEKSVGGPFIKVYMVGGYTTPTKNLFLSALKQRNYVTPAVDIRQDTFLLLASF